MTNLFASIFFVLPLLSVLFVTQPAGARPSPFQERIRHYARQDRLNPPPANPVVFTGSSSIAGWTTLATDFPRTTSLSRGLSGSSYQHLWQYREQLIYKYKPSAVVLYSGDNDLAAGVTPAAVTRNAFRLIGGILYRFPKAKIFILSVKPSPVRMKLIEQIRETNGLLAERAKEDRRVRFIDVHTVLLDEQGRPRPELFRSDGLHLTRRGYELWAEKLRPRLEP